MASSSPRQGGGWRPDLYVVLRFLDRLARPDSEMTRTQLQAAVGVNWDVFRRYLDLLVARGLVTVGQEDPPVVRLTAEGREMRRRLQEWLARLLGDDAWR